MLKEIWNIIAGRVARSVQRLVGAEKLRIALDKIATKDVPPIDAHPGALQDTAYQMRSWARRALNRDDS